MLVDCDVVSAVVVVTVMLTLASSASILSSSLAFGHLYEQGQMEVGGVKLSRKSSEKVIYGATFFSTRSKSLWGAEQNVSKRAIHPLSFRLFQSKKVA